MERRAGRGTHFGRFQGTCAWHFVTDGVSESALADLRHQAAHSGTILYILLAVRVTVPEGEPHFAGYIEFARPRRGSQVTTCLQGLRAHWEPV